MNAFLDAAASLYGAAWELRRRTYAAGLLRPRSVEARVVSVGNLSVGGTGKTTLTLHLARVARAAGWNAGLVCRRYRPGPSGTGDEEALFRAALGDGTVYAGRRKLDLARRAAADGRALVVVDDGFSHWPLDRDLDVVLLDAGTAPARNRLLPAGRLREPLRALQRAGVVVISRLEPGQDPEALMEAARRLAPAAHVAAGRHRIAGVRDLGGGSRAAEGRVLVVTGTGNPGAVERSAREAGFDAIGLAAYRDHHWFTVEEARTALARARAAGASVLLTAKDAVRWPAAAAAPDVAVLDVEWSWVRGGERAERMVLGERA